MMKKVGLRILVEHQPSERDIAVAREIHADACPRRYCWWWRTLSFTWQLSPAEGCAFLVAEKPKWWKHQETACMRAVTSSTTDHFEAREAQLIEDGFETDYWQRIL